MNAQLIIIVTVRVPFEIDTSNQNGRSAAERGERERESDVHTEACCVLLIHYTCARSLHSANDCLDNIYNLTALQSVNSARVTYVTVNAICSAIVFTVVQNDGCKLFSSHKVATL